MVSVALFAIIISIWLFTRLFCKGTKLKEFADDKFRLIFWNGIFRFYLEAYLNILIASLINIETSKHTFY